MQDDTITKISSAIENFVEGGCVGYQGTFFYEIKKNPVMDENGKILGITGIVKDVTGPTMNRENTKKISGIRW